MLKRQRGVITFALIAYAVLGIALVAVLGGLAWKAQHWCNVACADAQADAKSAERERDTLKTEKADAQRIAAGIATRYGEQVAATQRAEAQRDEARNAQFAPIIARARALPPDDARARVPASVVGVLDAAARAANAAGTAGGAPQAAPPAAAAADSSGELIAGWFAIVAQIHAECRDRVRAWEDFYSGLRAATDVPIGTKGTQIEPIL